MSKINKDVIMYCALVLNIIILILVMYSVVTDSKRTQKALATYFEETYEETITIEYEEN